MTRILTFLLAVAMTAGAKAQSYSLTGIIQNEGKRPLRSATVSIQVYNDSSIVFKTITDNKGAFEFKDIPAKVYRLTASFVDYDSLQQTVPLTDSSSDIGV